MQGPLNDQMCFCAWFSIELSAAVGSMMSETQLVHSAVNRFVIITQDLSQKRRKCLSEVDYAFYFTPPFQAPVFWWGIDFSPTTTIPLRLKISHSYNYSS